MDELNTFQQLFLLFFAILYGLLLSKLELLKPFPFSTLRKLTYEEISSRSIATNLSQMKKCKWRRIFISIFLLVLLPFSYLFFVLNILEKYDISFVNTFVHSWEINWMLGVISILFSFSIFGFYHLYCSISIAVRNWAFCDLHSTEDILSSRDSLMELFGALIILIIPWVALTIFSITS